MDKKQKPITVSCDINQHLATLTLRRSEVHNAINQQVIDELTGHLIKLKRNKEIRLLVLQGEGRSFSAGADIHWMKSMKDASLRKNMMESRKLAMLFKELNDFPKPILCKAQGGALGGGAGLVAVADYVLTDQEAIFGFSEVRLGLVPAVISPYVIAKIGESNARALFLSGMRFTAERAREMGLVHEVVHSDVIDKRLEMAIKEFLKAAPNAVMEAKALIRTVMEMQSAKNEKALIDYTCKKIAELRVSKEGQEGMAAMLEKREADWRE